MKPFATLCCFFLCSSLFAQSWNLVWADEFNGTNINTSNWLFETGGGGWGNAELENYTNRSLNAILSNGNLLIISRKESYGGSNYTSARLKTQGLQHWTYGKVEARIKMQAGKGMWPAFWMLGESISQSGWPSCGEIDIMEHVNTDSTVEGTMHWYNNGAAQYGGNTRFNPSGYHIYTVEWDSSAITWFLDGVKYWQGNIAAGINGTSSFHKPFFILLNQAVGGSWPGSPDLSTVFPDTLFVDYVRVYQDLATGLLSPSSQGRIQLHPNPATNDLTLTLENPEYDEGHLEITDLSGKALYQRDIAIPGNEKTDFRISVESYPPGLYFISLKSHQHAYHLKFIKALH